MTAARARAAKRGAALMSEVVLHLAEDLATLQRPRENRATRAGGRAEDARVAFGEAELVGHVRALHADLPVGADVRADAEVERVVGAELLQARLVLRVIADVRVRCEHVH